MDFSFLFDKNKSIDFRGLLAAILLPLFLMLAYNLGMLFLVVGGQIARYHNIITLWLIDFVSLFLLFYAGYKAIRYHNLGLISSLLTCLICFVLVTATVYYIDYYLFFNNIGAANMTCMKEYAMLPDMDVSPPSQIWHCKLPQECNNSGKSEINQLLCTPFRYRWAFKIFFGFVFSFVFGFAGWFIGRRYSLMEFFSLKGVKL